MRKVIVGVVAAAAFLFNPFFACSGPGFTFGEPEMKAAVEGTWRLTIGAQKWTLTIAQADRSEQSSRGTSLVGDAQACGDRSFVKSAGACVDLSTLPVVVTDGTGIETPGKLMVVGTEFQTGHLVVDGKLLRFDALIEPSGKVDSVDAGGKAVTLGRVATK